MQIAAERPLGPAPTTMASALGSSNLGGEPDIAFKDKRWKLAVTKISKCCGWRLLCSRCPVAMLRWTPLFEYATCPAPPECIGPGAEMSPVRVDWAQTQSSLVWYLQSARN